MLRRKTILTLCTALVAGAVTASSAVGAETCVGREARQALELRVLQSELMVAALTCGQRPRYNAFVTAFKPYLKTQGTALKAFFAQQFGTAAGPKRLNRLVTQLANGASQRSVREPNQDYCNRATSRFNQILEGDIPRLVQLAQANPAAGSHGFTTCVEMATVKAASASGQN